MATQMPLYAILIQSRPLGGMGCYPFVTVGRIGSQSVGDGLADPILCIAISRRDKRMLRSKGSRTRLHWIREIALLSWSRFGLCEGSMCLAIKRCFRLACGFKEAIELNPLDSRVVGTVGASCMCRIADVIFGRCPDEQQKFWLRAALRVYERPSGSPHFCSPIDMNRRVFIGCSASGR